MSLVERLVSGGDHRQLVDPVTGLSPYRVAPRPRGVVPFGSCTASSPSAIGWAAAERAAGRDAREVASEVRSRLAARFGVPADGEVLLCPSGTDALYLLTAIAPTRGAVHHVVVGAGELGGGTVNAALGRGFSRVAPHGPGLDALPGLATRCGVTAVELRDGLGAPRPLGVLDAEVDDAVERAWGWGAHVVLTMVAHSKTGLCAPSPELVARVAAAGPARVTVVVDAAQGRLEPADVASCLTRGWVVLLTGSKFWGGPAFSGVLLLPASRAMDPGVLPAGLDAWVAAENLPAGWTLARQGLTAVNEGLGLRWSAALAEIDATLDVPQAARLAVFAAFREASRQVALPWVDAPVRAHPWMTGMSPYPSILPFDVPGTLSEVTAAHREVDAAGWHLGQPVRLGGPESARWALRVALGAPLVRLRAGDADAGLGWFVEHFARLAEVVGPAQPSVGTR